MTIQIKTYLERSENKLLLAKINYEISTQDAIKETLNIPLEKTFYNEVISECYYAIFYSAKALLLAHNINTKPPEEHKKTYSKFKEIIESKKQNKKLNKIYDEETKKAQTLLRIFKEEKKNRGRFTYKVNSNANKPFAKQSIKNAKFFTATIKYLIDK